MKRTITVQPGCLLYVVVALGLFLLGSAVANELRDDPLLVQSIETDDGTACIVLLSGDEPRGLSCEWGTG